MAIASGGESSMTFRAADVVKLGPSIPISAEMLADMGEIRPLSFGFDRHLRPWRYPDRRGWPTFVPFPRLARWQARIAAFRQRVADVRYAVRYGLPEVDEWD